MYVILTSCVVIFIFLYKYYDGKRRPEPPAANAAIPILGHAWLALLKRERLYNIALNTILNPSLERGHELVHMRVGMWKIYVCTNPEDGMLMMNSFLKKDPMYNFLNPLSWGGEGLITADVPLWKVHRKLLNPTMNQSILDTYLPEFNDHSRQLVTVLDHEVGKTAFDHFPYIRKTILYCVCATIMGVSIEDDKLLIEEFGLASETFTSCVTERVLKFYYHTDFIYNWSNLKKKQDSAVTIAQNVTCEVIRRKKAKIFQQEEQKHDQCGSKFKSLLDQLLEMGREGCLTENEIKQEVATFMTAAFDTTFHAIAMTILTVGSYPTVQQKIVDELQSVFGESTRNAEKQDLSKLKYIEAVIKETMRLYPIVPTIGRTLDKDIKIKNYTLRAGRSCFLSIYHVGRHAVWGVDVEQFRPERWLDGSLPREAGAFAAFGLGRRSCIGSNFAMMLMKTVLCHVVRAYRISGDVTRLVQYLDIVATPASGHHITLQRRVDVHGVTNL